MYSVAWGNDMSLVNRRLFLSGAGAGFLAAAIPARYAFAQGASPMPPAPTVEQWTKSPAVQHVTLSADGTHIAFIKEENGQKYIYDVDLRTKAFQPYAIGNVKVQSLAWIDATHLMLSTFTTGKEDMFAGGRETFTLVTVYNLEKKTINVLFSRVENFKNIVMGGVRRIEIGGKAYLTAASYPLNGDENKCLYRFDLDNADKAVLLDRAPWDTEGWVMTPDGTLLARAMQHSKQKSWSLDYFTNGAWKEIFRQPADLSGPGLWGLARDGKSLIVSMPSGIEGGSYTYHEMSPDGKLSPPLLSDNLNQSPIFDPVTFRHCGFEHYDGWPELTYFDPAMQALYKKAQAAVDGYRMIIEDTADDPKKMVIYTEGDDDAGSYYFIDFNTGATTPVGSQYPQIAPEWITAKKLIKYKAGDGLEIEAYLTLPPNREPKNLPMIMHPHGGPQARDGLEIDWETQIYATLGYTVLQPNFRGSSGYGQDFVDAGHGEWGRKMQSDLSDGVRELVKQGIVDPKRVAIVGASYGGYAALAGAALDKGVYNCAVDVAGISDVKALLDSERPAGVDTEPASYRYLKRFLGDQTRLDEISPIKHVADVTIPVLIIHGKDDTVVPMGQSTSMTDAMKRSGKDITFVQYDHEDHWETNETARTDMMKVIVGFLKTHNPA